MDNNKSSVLRLIVSQDDHDLASSEMFNLLKVANCYRDSNGTVRDALNAAGFPQESGVLVGYALDNIILGYILYMVIPYAMDDTIGCTLSKN
jgi:hypothetical protein